MRKHITFLLLLLGLTAVSQDNPYQVFGYAEKKEYKIFKPYIVSYTNDDTAAEITRIDIDYLNHEVSIFKSDSISPQKVQFSDGQFLRFLSVDPLTKSFPELTPYQYSSNRPIDGIDLDGLEYLSANEARITVIQGRAHINLENFNTVTRNSWAKRDAQGNYPNGFVGWPTQVGQLKSPDLISSTKTARLGPKSNPPTYNPTLLEQTSSAPLPGIYGTANSTSTSNAVKGAAAFTLALNAVNWALEVYGNEQIAEDQKLVNEHLLILSNQVHGDIATGIQSGMIPDKYQNVQDIGSIANVILSGNNPSGNQDIYDIGINIVKEISGNYRPQFDVLTPESPVGADNTRVSRSIVTPSTREYK